MNENEMTKNIVESIKSFAEPIDFKKLLEDGVLTLKGKSYYITDLNLLPEHVSKKLKSIEPTKNGIKVTFYKETKAIQKLARKLNGPIS